MPFAGMGCSRRVHRVQANEIRQFGTTTFWRQLERRIAVLLAVERLSAGWETVLYGIAVVLFVLGFLGFKVTAQRVRLDSLGLAVFVFVFFWNSWARY